MSDGVQDECSTRPKTIVAFETLYLATLLLGLIQTIAHWNEMVAVISPASAVAVQMFVFGVTLTLVLLVSRRRSRIAMWIMIGLFLLGLPVMAGLLRAGLLIGWPLANLASMVTQIVALALLFSRSARHWLDRRNEAIRQTFL